MNAEPDDHYAGPHWLGIVILAMPVVLIVGALAFW